MDTPQRFPETSCRNQSVTQIHIQEQRRPRTGWRRSHSTLAGGMLQLLSRDLQRPVLVACQLTRH